MQYLNLHSKKSGVVCIVLQEPIEEVELKQQRILQTVKSLEKGLREMRNDQEKMMVALTKLAQANGISTEQDDYAGEVNDDEV